MACLTYQPFPELPAIEALGNEPCGRQRPECPRYAPVSEASGDTPQTETVGRTAQLPVAAYAMW
ncbi:hypothetical protein G5S37_18925 [Roseimicrobium sp. ORNL1]|nr:hypothetical protein G5S37_18925 [Roseimicrobium sp. ORNL1]